jgi:membrane protein implicated in regulation of membrane protease activity
MENYLLWAIAGFVLVIIELVSGTFYLLVLGLAALFAAAAAYAGAAIWLQVIIAAATALLGIVLVRRWWSERPKADRSQNSLDIGQTVVLDAWVNQAAGLARVRYRGSLWDAKLAPDVHADDVLVIKAQDNGVLLVAARS